MGRIVNYLLSKQGVWLRPLPRLRRMRWSHPVAGGRLPGVVSEPTPIPRGRSILSTRSSLTDVHLCVRARARYLLCKTFMGASATFDWEKLAAGGCWYFVLIVLCACASVCTCVLAGVRVCSDQLFLFGGWAELLVLKVISFTAQDMQTVCVNLRIWLWLKVKNFTWRF